MKKIKITITICILLLAQLVIGVALATALLAHIHRDVIIPGTVVGGVDVGGVAPGEALKKLRLSYPQPTDDSVLLLTANDEYSWEILFGDINFAYDYQSAVDQAFKLGKTISPLWHISDFYSGLKDRAYIPLSVKFNEQALRIIIEDINHQYRQVPVDAQVAYSEEQIVLLPETFGWEIDVEATIKGFVNNAAGNPRVELVVSTVNPQLTSKDLRDINSRLGIYVTGFDLNQNGRVHNLQLASEKVNNTLVKPGEVFSLNQSLGPRTPENGYKKAPVIVDYRMREDYGGGVCQLATTLYNAVVIAGLPVVERHRHTIPVNYVPPGKDAAIAGNIKDFRFKNDGEKAILINSKVEEDKLVVIILGHRDDAKNIEYRTETEREVIPYETVFKADNNLEPGVIKVVKPGREGYHITTYEVTVINEVIVEKQQIAYHHVEPENALILIPVNTGKPNKK